MGFALALAALPAHAESAASLFKHGQSAEAREDYDAAFDNYQKAYNREPKDLRYRAALYRVRVPAAAAHLAKARKLEETSDVQAALVGQRCLILAKCRQDNKKRTPAGCGCFPVLGAIAR